LLSITNTFEGNLNVFVDQNTSATVQVADYVSQLFPNFNLQEINTATAQCAGLGTNVFQVNAIMGECELSIHPCGIFGEAADFFGSDLRLSYLFVVMCV
jgi:hypothetical protein